MWPMKTQSELEEQYRKADLAELSDLYFSCEGASARRRHFESTWLAIGFQAQDAPVPDLEHGQPGEY
jgi:hypothetical protein